MTFLRGILYTFRKSYLLPWNWWSYLLAVLFRSKVIYHYEPRHEISNNVVHACLTCKASDQPAHTCSLIRAGASRVKLLTEYHLQFLSLKEGCSSWVRCGTWLYRFLIFAPLLTLSVSTLVKIPHCWKSHVAGLIYYNHFWRWMFQAVFRGWFTVAPRCSLLAKAFRMERVNIKWYLITSYFKEIIVILKKTNKKKQENKKTKKQQKKTVTGESRPMMDLTNLDDLTFIVFQMHS